MTFTVGQKAVCVDAKISRMARITGASTLTQNQIYTIRHIEVWEGVECVRLVEIVDPPYHFIDRGWLEPSWRASRFRPIVSRKTSIEIFKRLLVPGTKILETV